MSRWRRTPANSRVSEPTSHWREASPSPNSVMAAEIPVFQGGNRADFKLENAIRADKWTRADGLLALYAEFNSVFLC